MRENTPINVFKTAAARNDENADNFPVVDQDSHGKKDGKSKKMDEESSLEQSNATRSAKFSQSNANQKERNKLLSSDRSKGDESTYQNIGRNDSCPCGSGKKYKKCCLQ